MFTRFRLIRLHSHGALALALVAAAATASLVASPSFAKEKKPAAAPAGAKITLSKPFMPIFVAMNKAIEDAKKKPEVLAAQQSLAAANTAYNAATTTSARKTANAQRDAAIAALGASVAAEKAQLDGAFAAATTPDDKYIAGQLGAQFGALSQDRKLIRQGYETMLGSGKYPAADVPKLQSAIGEMCYDLKDYACAQLQLTAAVAGGQRSGNIEVLLADSMIQQGQVTQGLQQLMTTIQARKASGTFAPEDWYRRGLSAAYKAKLLDQAANFSSALVEAYPSKDNWGGAVSVLRLVAKYEVQERLDLMRLMARTHSFAEGADYAEFIQAADPRRAPAEVLVVLEEGLAAGKLQAGDIFVSEARTQAVARKKEDAAALPGLEKLAMAPNATGNAVAATADAFLSNSQPAKAEMLYSMAMQKGGVDMQRMLTRLGIAQVDQGKYAEAKANFIKIEGIRKPLAQLWITYADQKAKGG